MGTNKQPTQKMGKVQRAEQFKIVQVETKLMSVVHKEHVWQYKL